MIFAPRISKLLAITFFCILATPARSFAASETGPRNKILEFVNHYLPTRVHKALAIGIPAVAIVGGTVAIVLWKRQNNAKPDDNQNSGTVEQVAPSTEDQKLKSEVENINCNVNDKTAATVNNKSALENQTSALDGQPSKNESTIKPPKETKAPSSLRKLQKLEQAIKDFDLDALPTEGNKRPDLLGVFNKAHENITDAFANGDFESLFDITSQIIKTNEAVKNKLSTSKKSPSNKCDNGYWLDLDQINTSNEVTRSLMSNFTKNECDIRTQLPYPDFYENRLKFLCSSRINPNFLRHSKFSPPELLARIIGLNLRDLTKVYDNKAEKLGILNRFELPQHLQKYKDIIGTMVFQSNQIDDVEVNVRLSQIFGSVKESWKHYTPGGISIEL